MKGKKQVGQRGLSRVPGSGEPVVPHHLSLGGDVVAAPSLKMGVSVHSPQRLQRAVTPTLSRVNSNTFTIKALLHLRDANTIRQVWKC